MSAHLQDAGRADLKEKEDAQIAILDEYAGGIETMSEEEMHVIIGQVIDGLKTAGNKIAMGDVLKRTLAPGGVFDGKPVEKSAVVRIAKELLLGSQ